MNYIPNIKAQLYANELTKEPSFIARVVSEKSLNVKDICESAVNRGGADVSAATMEHSVNYWLKEMGYRLRGGFFINAGWFNAQTSIKGVFSNPAEKFAPSKHTIYVDINQGVLLRQELGDVKVEIKGVAEPTLKVEQVDDIKTGSVNDLLTPNRPLRITGGKLRIAGESDKNGIFFINQKTNERIKVDNSDIVNNYPSELIIVIPSLEAGTYKLDVTTQFSSSGSSKHLLKGPRTTVFDKVLTVLDNE